MDDGCPFAAQQLALNFLYRQSDDGKEEGEVVGVQYRNIKVTVPG